jgi:hypothetical protein
MNYRVDPEVAASLHCPGEVLAAYDYVGVYARPLFRDCT